MNRRDALATLGFTALSSVAATKPLLLQAMLTDAPADQAVEDRLRQDISRLGPRVDSEEGIAMILACENLVPDKLSHEPPKPALLPVNAALAAAVHRNAEAWLRIHPDAQYKDVAQLIEVLAYRDVSHGGAGEAL